MLGFSPLASATLADDGIVSIAIGATAITTGAPTVESSTITQSHSLNASAVTGSAPVIDSPTVTRQLPADSVTCGTPVVDPISISSQHHIFREHIGEFRVSASGGKFYIQDYSSFLGIARGAYIETPTLELHSGVSVQDRVYRFWLTGSGMYSGGSTIHDFRLRTPDGTEYTDGVVFTGGLGSERLELTLGANPPEYLQYYCANHSGMGSDIFIKIVSTAAEGALNTQIATSAPTIDTPQITVNYVLTANSISASAPTIDNSTVVIDHSFDAVINIGAPSVDSSIMTGVHGLTSTDITNSVPTIDTSTLIKNVALTATSITTGAVQINIPTVNESDDFVGVSIRTGVPQVDQTSLIENYQFTSDDIVTSPPVVDSPDYFIQLTANHITTGAVQIDIPSANESNECVAISITTGLPVVSQSTILDASPLINPDIDGANDLIMLNQANEVYISIDVSDAIIDEEVVLANVA